MSKCMNHRQRRHARHRAAREGRVYVKQGLTPSGRYVVPVLEYHKPQGTWYGRQVERALLGGPPVIRKNRVVWVIPESYNQGYSSYSNHIMDPSGTGYSSHPSLSGGHSGPQNLPPAPPPLNPNLIPTNDGTYVERELF